MCWDITDMDESKDFSNDTGRELTTSQSLSKYIRLLSPICPYLKAGAYWEGQDLLLIEGSLQVGHILFPCKIWIRYKGLYQVGG